MPVTGEFNRISESADLRLLYETKDLSKTIDSLHRAVLSRGLPG